MVRTQKLIFMLVMIELAAYTGSLEKVPLGTKANREAAKKMRSGMEELILDAEEEDAGDEEAREWEEAQIRRGEQGRDDIGPGGGRDKRRAKKTYRPPPSSFFPWLYLGD